MPSAREIDGASDNEQGDTGLSTVGRRTKGDEGGEGGEGGGLIGCANGDRDDGDRDGSGPAETQMVKGRVVSGDEGWTPEQETYL